MWSLRYSWQCLLVGVLCALNAPGQPASVQPTDDSPTTEGAPPSAAEPAPVEDLAAAQQAVRERLLRLEGLMLKLTPQLEETEPEQAERLRNMLAASGKRRIKARLEQLVRILGERGFSDAEREQSALLDDLNALLEILRTEANQMDAAREERRRLEGFRRAIRVLQEEQADHLERSRKQAANMSEAPGSQPGDRGAPAGDEEEARTALKNLEAMQRQTQRSAAELRDQMGADPERSTPGQQQMSEAQDRMQAAADRLGEQQPDAAADAQAESLDHLQAALNELEEALRQVRQNEIEDTLEALEARFQRMLEAERGVAGVVQDVARQPREAWSRHVELRVLEAAASQSAIVEQAEAALRILQDEGTTLVLPELVAGLTGQMREIATSLSRRDVGPPVQSSTAHVVKQLETILAALAREREQHQARASEPPPASASGTPQSDPLLPASAELKLLRAAQLQIVEQMQSLASPGDAKTAHARQLVDLRDRQAALARLAARMWERQQ